jgi:protein-S-isoprenylcysteine O-methyltransferase Ste14
VTGVALVVYAAFVVAALPCRAWLQYRRTGDHGLRGLPGKRGSIEWFGVVLLAGGMTLAAAGPVAELVGLIKPWRITDASWRSVPGLVLAVVGCVVTIVAQLQMRDSWRVGVADRETTPLVTAGLFSVVRNPIFTGMLFLMAGLFCMAPNVLSMAAFGNSVLGVEIHVRRVEEPYLLHTHGTRYLSYARVVGRFLPWLGRLA